MGNVHDVVLAAPHPDYSRGRRVEAGLRELGFTPADAHPNGEGATLWTRLSLKLPLDLQPRSMEGLRDAVIALPWNDWGVATHLQVLWMDEHTTEDDSMGGRVSPYAWRHETWEVPR